MWLSSREARKISSVFTRVETEEVLAGPQGHHDLFERGVASPLPDPVDGALHLPGAVHDGGERVGHRLTEVVVAVDGQDHAVDAIDALPDLRDPLAPLPGMA